MQQCKAQGVIIAELPSAHGTTKNGNDWEKREYVMEVDERYHKNMRFSMYSWDGPIENPLSVGDKIELSFTVEAHESKGSWYNEVKAYNLKMI